MSDERGMESPDTGPQGPGPGDRWVQPSLWDDHGASATGPVTDVSDDWAEWMRFWWEDEEA